MIQLSNNTAQTIEVGQSVAFTLLRKTGKSELFNGNNGVYLRDGGQFLVMFSANITGPTAATPVQLSIAINGVARPETAMISVPAAASDFNNVATQTSINTEIGCCGFNVGSPIVTVVNTGTTAITIGANPSLLIGRVG